jgi:hypothetical protein
MTRIISVKLKLFQVLTLPLLTHLGPLTLGKVAAVQVEVDDDALTKAIKAVKVAVRTSGRPRVDSKTVQANK